MWLLVDDASLCVFTSSRVKLDDAPPKVIRAPVPAPLVFGPDMPHAHAEEIFGSRVKSRAANGVVAVGNGQTVWWLWVMVKRCGGCG